LTLEVERAVVAHEGFLETVPRFRGWTFLRNLERKLGRCKADARPSMRLDGAGRPKYLDSLLIADVAREITRYYRALGRIEPIHDDYEWPKKEHPGRATLTADCQSRANGRPHEPESEPASDEEDRAFVRRNRDYQTDILVPVLCALFLQKTVNGAWCFPGDNYAPFFHRHRNEPEKILAVLVEGAKYRW
jgi:hypothetical protein